MCGFTVVFAASIRSFARVACPQSCSRGRCMSNIVLVRVSAVAYAGWHTSHRRASDAVEDLRPDVRAKLGLARCLYSDAPIVLLDGVLDALGSWVAEGLGNVLDALGGRTVLVSTTPQHAPMVLAHLLPKSVCCCMGWPRVCILTYCDASRVADMVVMEAGRVVEQGTPAQLLPEYSSSTGTETVPGHLARLLQQCDLPPSLARLSLAVERATPPAPARLATPRPPLDMPTGAADNVVLWSTFVVWAPAHAPQV